MPTKLKSKKLPKEKFPLYCDYTCTYADFAPKDAVGDCRKELAVYCTLLKRFNNKNARCLVKRT